MPASSLLSYLLSSISLPAMAGPQALLASVPLLRLVESNGVGIRDKAPITFEGVPIQVVLARLNAKRGLPMGRKAKLKPLAKKGCKEPREDGDRAEVKAVLREHGREAHATQRAYEAGFLRHKRWNWRQVERELSKRHLGWAGLAILAAEVGVMIALGHEIVARAA